MDREGTVRAQGHQRAQVTRPTSTSCPRTRRSVSDPCQDAIATLYGYLDGELTSERREKIQYHLEECSPCFAAFGFEAELKAVIARKCRDDVPIPCADG